MWSYDKTCKEYIKPQSKIETKSILQYDLEGNLIKKYKSINVASSQTGINYRNIYKGCENKDISLVRGFIWGYEDEIEVIQSKIEIFKNRPYYQKNKRQPPKNAIQIEQYTLNGTYIKNVFISKRCKL